MKLFTYIAPFVVLPYLSRVLGAEGFGLMIAALSLAMFANVFTDFGFELSATYLIARKKNNKKYISKIISAIYSLKLALLAIVLFFVGIYLKFEVSYTPIAIAAIYITVFFQTFVPIWLFQGIERMKLITYFTIVSRLIYVCIVFVLVGNEDDYDLALMCNAIATVIACLLANALILKEGFALVKPSKRLMKLTLAHSSQFFLSRATLQASSSLSVLILSSSVGAAQVGLFGAAQKLFRALISLIHPFSQALYPYMADTNNTTLLLRIVFALSVIMLIPVSIGYVFSEQIITLLFGVDFAAARDLLRIFLITGYVGFITICMGYPAFASLRRVDLANKSVIISGIFQILFLIALYVSGNVTPVTIAFSILTTEFITLVLRVYWFTRLRKKTNLVAS